MSSYGFQKDKVAYFWYKGHYDDNYDIYGGRITKDFIMNDIKHYSIRFYRSDDYFSLTNVNLPEDRFFKTEEECVRNLRQVKLEKIL